MILGSTTVIAFERKFHFYKGKKQLHIMAIAENIVIFHYFLKKYFA